MSYSDRWLLFEKETAWGTWVTPSKFPNYLMEWDATTTDNKTEEDLIGGSRDYRKRVWLERGVVGRWTQELVSGKIFEFVLGSKSGTVSPVTYSLSSTLPSMSVYRGLAPSETGGTVSIGYIGMKVDTAELTIEKGSGAALEVNMVGKNATLPAAIAKPSLNMAVDPFVFADYVKWKGTDITDVSRVVISFNHNLSARTSTTGGSLPVTIREGAFEVSGRLTVGSQFGTFQSDILSRSEGTLEIQMTRSGSTLKITLKNVAFGELPDTLRGLDVVEWEIPFTARPASGLDAVTIEETFSGTWDSLPY
jgi:hypothetical protein